MGTFRNMTIMLRKEQRAAPGEGNCPEISRERISYMITVGAMGPCDRLVRDNQAALTAKTTGHSSFRLSYSQ